MATFEAEVLVIGGGWTGVSAAVELEARGIAFKLLEAHPDRLGGRAYSFAYNPHEGGEPLHWEHGAQYIGKAQTAIWALIQAHCPDQLMDGYTLRKQYPQQIMVIDKKRYSYARDACLFNIGGLPPGLGFFDLLATSLMIDQIETIERAIDVLAPWESPAALMPLDQVTLAQWLDGLRWLSPTARSLVAVSANAVLSVEPDQLSPFYFFWYSACNDGFLQECNDEDDGPQQYYLKCGVDELVRRVAEPIASRIVFDAAVASVTLEDGGVTVVTAGGDTWRAQQVILAMSPRTASKLSFTPPLPPAYAALTEQPMGTTIKCMVFYKSPWWRKSHGVAYTGYSGAASGGVTWVMDYSPDDGSDVWCLMTFTIGESAKAFGPTPDKAAVTRLVTREMCFLFDDTAALEDGGEFLSLEFCTWNEHTPFAGGGPNTVFGPGVLTGPDAPAKALNAPWNDAVWFACAETARNVEARATSRYYDPHASEAGAYSDIRHSLGYMDGAIHEGRFVANQVAKARGVAYDTRIDATFPSKPPRVKLPGEPIPMKRSEVSGVLKSLVALFLAKAALQAVTPVDPTKLIEQVGEMVGAALLMHFTLPTTEHLTGFILSGNAALASGDTDDDTRDIRYNVGILEGLVAVLSAATTTAEADARRGRLARVAHLARAARHALG